jgi:hypothetical protein
VTKDGRTERRKIRIDVPWASGKVEATLDCSMLASMPGQILHLDDPEG